MKKNCRNINEVENFVSKETRKLIKSKETTTIKIVIDYHKTYVKQYVVVALKE